MQRKHVIDYTPDPPYSITPARLRVSMSSHICETFHYCPRCGGQPASAGSHPFRCGACDYRFFFSPVTAVGGIVTDGTGRILFLVRGRDPGKGKYGLPGGFVDPGETLEESLRREIMEEASLVVNSLEYLCSFPNEYNYREVVIDVIDAFFVCEVRSFEGLKPQAGEVSRFLHTEPTEEVLGNLAFPSNRRAMECYLARTAAGN